MRQIILSSTAVRACMPYIWNCVVLLCVCTEKLRTRNLCVLWLASARMPRKYSEDFRWRIVFQHCLQGKPIRDVAKNNHIGHSTVERLVSLYKRTGEVRSIQEKHGPERKLSEQEEFIVLQLFLDSPGIYLREVQLELHDKVTWPETSEYCCALQLCNTLRLPQVHDV